MKTFDKWTATLSLAAVSAFALTQGPPPPGQGPGGPGFPGQGPGQGRGPGGPGFPGGPGQGGPGGMMRGPGMMMPGGPMLLRRPDVQKELKLSEEQIEKIDQILGGPGFGPPPPGGQPRGGQPQGPPPPGQAGPGGGFPGGPPQGPGGGFQGGPPQGGPGQGGPGGGFQRRQGPGGEERVAQLEKQLKTVLTEAQFTRYQQLTLQFEGPAALGRKDVADKVGLSEETRAKIGELLRGQGRRGPGGPGQGGFPGGPPPQGGGFQGGPPPDMEQMRQQMEKQRKELGDKILALLSAEEKSKWHSLLGKEFKFERMGPPRGGENG